jgi:CIC family chloride channel protein
MKKPKKRFNLRRTRRYLQLRQYRAIKWFRNHISDRNYMVVVCILIGIVAGLAAMALKYGVFAVREWMQGNDPTHGRVGFVFFPLVGILLTYVYIRYVLRKRLDMGFSGLIFAISRKKVNRPRYEMYAHILSSSLTVGFGGSVGLEAPIVRTGSAIGSNLASWLQVGRTRHTLFLACGAAAGMAAIFNSPVAAMIFAFEILISDIALSSFIPLLISSATGAVVARYFYYEQLFYLPTAGWSINHIPFYILLGILCGLYSVYMIRTVLFFESYFQRRKVFWQKMLLGGLALGLMIFLLPPLFGEGYETVNHLLKGEYEMITQHSLFFFLSDQRWFLLVFALAIILVKTVATAVTLALGGNGGVFAPAMFAGAVLGFIFAAAVNELGFVELHTADFIAVAMAGILSGVIKSPLTGIFLIAEITGGYELFVPLMIVSAMSYFIAYPFEPHSIFTKGLFRQGLWLPSHEKDGRILQSLQLSSLMERNFSVLHPNQTLGEFVKVIAKSHRNVFPVTDEQEQFLGIILLDDVRDIMFNDEKYHRIKVSDIMHLPPAVLHLDEPMEEVMKKFDQHNAWNLPVVKDGKYLGFASKSSVFNRYRELLKEANEDG